MDDLIERLEAQVPTGTPLAVCHLLDEAAAELRTLRAERDAAHAAGLAEGVALGIEAAAQSLAYPGFDAGIVRPIDKRINAALGEACATIRDLNPAAIIAARKRHDTIGDSDGA
jgi:hypothetical protein